MNASIDLKNPCPESDQFGRRDPVNWAIEVEKMETGENLITSIDHEGTWTGFALELIIRVADVISKPVIAHGGVGSVKHVSRVIKQAYALAALMDSMVVFLKKNGVFVIFSNKDSLAIMKLSVMQTLYV